MNTSTRLRQLADRMGLDGFAEELREIAGELEAKAAPAALRGFATLNEWFLSLPEQRQAQLRDDKWMLAGAAFEAGQALAPAVPMSESQRADMICAVAAICTGTSSRTVAATAIEWVERYYGITTPATPSQDHVTDGFPWEAFPVWLLEHHEGETITKECLTYALGKMFFALGKKSGGA